MRFISYRNLQLQTKKNLLLYIVGVKFHSYQNINLLTKEYRFATRRSRNLLTKFKINRTFLTFIYKTIQIKTTTSNNFATTYLKDAKTRLDLYKKLV